MMPDSFYPEVLFHWRTFRGVAFVAILFYSIFDYVYAFNVDIPSAVTYHGASQSMFGFTVAQYKEAIGGKSWVLIGAPESRDSVYGSKYSNYEGGAVYYCDVNKNDKCYKINFPNIEPGKPDNRTAQWLGAALTTEGSESTIVACAPRYYWSGMSGNLDVDRLPVGSCYYSDRGFSSFTEYSPCRNKLELPYCQAGFSASISKEGDRFYVGAVSSYKWKGKLITRNVLDSKQTKGTEEPLDEYDDTYLGYSMTSLDFYKFSMSGVAAGVPRANNLTGEVKLYTWNMINFKILTGEQFAAYFGYSICKSDVDGDGTDDLIIGAPMYSNFEPTNKEYETGRIYVYYQGNVPCSSYDYECAAKKFSAYHFIDGEHSKGRFGLAVASLGDINQDGFGDFAVGAPYEGSSNDCREALRTGAVYIYHGGRNGVRKKYSQVIRAENLYLSTLGSSLRAFGFSISGGQDFDNNLYPDVVVGAYESDVAFLFRSKPVIKLDVDFKFLSENKIIDLNEYRCNLDTNVRVPCVVLQMCLVYDGIGVENDIKLLLEITLDSENSKASRMFFLERESERIMRDEVPLHKGTPLCKNMTTYIARLKPNQDKLTPFEAQLKYWLVESSYKRPSGLPSVLNFDDEIPLTRKDSMSIKNNCGDDNICIPDLQMSVNSSVNQYVLGSGHLIINVSILNEGEDSFGSNFKLKIPSGMNYSRFEVTKPENDVVVECYSPKDDNNITIHCDVGNPLPSGKMVNFSIILEPKDEVEESRFEFWAACNSTNAEFSNTTANNERLIYVQILEETSLTIVGTSSPNDIYYNISQYEDETIESDKEVGPILKHEYIIRNLGPSEVSEATAVFFWPLKISTNEDLLYLLNKPETKGNIECERIGNTNYRHLKVKRKYKEEGNSESWHYISESETSSGISSGTNTTSYFSPNGFESNHLCSSAKCDKMQCYIKRLRRDEEVSVTFSSIVWIKTLQKIASFRPVQVGSYVEVNVTKFSHITAQVSNLTYTSEVLTNIISLDFGKTPPDVVPLWIVVGAITLGTLILMLLIYLLYKSGFFKRNRPTKMPSEQETLNENGQHHLDDDAHDKAI